MRSQPRIAALVSLVAYSAGVAVVVFELSDAIGALLVALLALIAASVSVWFALTRTGPTRLMATLLAAIFLAVGGWVLADHTAIIDVVVVLALLALGSFLARAAYGFDRPALRSSPPPGIWKPAPIHPVLLMNPRSGGGKVRKFGLEHEARLRGIEPVVLSPGDDLEALARDAVARGADALGMAGGDGSQAIVAAVASEHDLPFVCIPAGTRNHLALDLGVDREDVVGSLDAFLDGYERVVDLALVNGRVFVNNVSLGVYAEIVQSDAYRDAKFKTVGEMLPELLGPASRKFSFDLDSADGTLDRACLVLVSNNVYELERLGGMGTRAHLDRGVLGVLAVEIKHAADVAEFVALELAGRGNTFAGWHAWSVGELEIRSDDEVVAGVDGEALTFPAPLRFEIAPGALRVRVARSAFGISPARVAQGVRRGGLVTLVRIGFGRGAPDGGAEAGDYA